VGDNWWGKEGKESEMMENGDEHMGQTLDYAPDGTRRHAKKFGQYAVLGTCFSLFSTHDYQSLLIISFSVNGLGNVHTYNIIC